MRPDHNTGNSMLYMRYSLAHQRRLQETLMCRKELLTFCHIFKSCTQDSRTVLAVMANVIQQRKSTMPRMDTVFYRQGQCWVLPLRGQHCWRKHHRQGAAIRRLDFTNAQGGKGACDRKAATIKVHMQAFKTTRTLFVFD